jgi:hypothetical protein
VRSTDEAAIADLRRIYDLARTLHNLGVCLNDLERWDEALATKTEAAAVHTEAVDLLRPHSGRAGEQPEGPVHPGAGALQPLPLEMCQAMDLDHRVESVEKARMKRIFTSAVKCKTDLLERLGRHDEAHPVLRVRKALRPEPGDRSGEL